MTGIPRGVRRPRWRAASGVLLTVLLAGCGGLHPVEGQVVWEDGSPAKELEGGEVVFERPETKTSARGPIGADGTFRLTTTNPGDGAPAGTYKVMILENRKFLAGEGSALAPGVMDARFTELDKSGLTETVRSGTNRVTLKVQRARR